MTTIKMQLTERECRPPRQLEQDETPAFLDMASYPMDFWWEEIGQHSSRFRLEMIDMTEPKTRLCVESPSFFRDGRKPGEKERALHETLHHAAKCLAKRIL